MASMSDFNSSNSKIKGGKWTVFRFFAVSVGYTAVWLAVSSELGYYRRLYGPQVLLQLNIAYYAPSIPLLLFASFFDEALEAKLGVARTILARLVTGLLGYAAICAWFPFMPQSLWFLLASVVALGACSGLAFSASYQLVARFANKSVIALGMGCSCSGPLVLGLQLLLRMGQDPTHRQHVLLYETIAAIVMFGLWATVSLLLRHWDAIEASAQPQDDLEEPLVPQGAHGSMESGPPRSPPAPGPPPSGLKRGSPGPIFRQPSLPPLAAYSQLEPYHTFLSEDSEWDAHNRWQRRRRRRFSFGGSRRLQSSTDGLESPSADARSGDAPGAGDEGQPLRSLSLPQLAASSKGGSAGEAAGGLGVHAAHEATASVDGGQGSGDEEEDGGGSPVVTAVRVIWPALIAMGLQAGVALTIFPFFTYLPSSGLLGEDLPRVLFFGRIFADVAGRMLPRVPALRPVSIWPVLAVAAAHLAAEPLFFLYLQSPTRYHSDAAVMAYVAAMWAASGYVNSGANMCAPKMVPPRLKSAAAGLMALTYQAGHVVALALATLIAVLLFGFRGDPPAA